jgi:hypothetical protein
MITEFKRPGRLARAWFAVLFVALGGLTFTRAADPKPDATNTGPPPAAAAAATPFRDNAAATPTPKASLDYRAEYLKQSTLLEQLWKMAVEDHPRFIQALSVTVSDPILNSLLQQELSQETRLAGLKTSLGPNAPQTREQDALINDLKKRIDQRAEGIIAGMSLQTSALKAAANVSLDHISSKRLEDWLHAKFTAHVDYLRFSNILATLTNIPTNKLGAALMTAYTHELDPELVSLADNLQRAKERMVEVEAMYKEGLPDFQAAKKHLEESQRAYDNKVAGVMAGIRTRVEQDKQYLQIIEEEMQKIEKSYIADLHY